MFVDRWYCIFEFLQPIKISNILLKRLLKQLYTIHIGWALISNGRTHSDKKGDEMKLIIILNQTIQFILLVCRLVTLRQLNLQFLWRLVDRIHFISYITGFYNIFIVWSIFFKKKWLLPNLDVRFQSRCRLIAPTYKCI